MTKARTMFYTANQIGHNRCTITGAYARKEEAQSAVGHDSESRYFAAASADDASDMAVGMRVYHRDGLMWAAGPGSPNGVPGRNW